MAFIADVFEAASVALTAGNKLFDTVELDAPPVSTGVKSTSENPTEGLAEYRNGDFQTAIDWFTRSRNNFTRAVAAERSAGRRSNNTECQVTSNYFLAMAQNRCGDQTKAKETLAVARQQLATQVPSITSLSAMVGTEDWLIVHIAAREADALMGK